MRLLLSYTVNVLMLTFLTNMIAKMHRYVETRTHFFAKIMKRHKLRKRLKNVFMFDHEIEGSFLWVKGFLMKQSSLKGGKQ